jgi:hypothetical protein
MGIIHGPAGANMPELFATRLSHSGAGFSCNLGGVLGGAVAPLVVTALAETSSPSAGGWFMVAVSRGCQSSSPPMSISRANLRSSSVTARSQRFPCRTSFRPRGR